MRVSSDRQPVGVLCFYSLTLASVLLLLILAACSSSAPPAEYVWTDQDNLVLLTWDDQSEQLSGTYTRVSYDQTFFPASAQPVVTTSDYTGRLADGSVTLHIGTGAFAEDVTGWQSKNWQSLVLTIIRPSTGQRTSENLVAITADQQSTLLAAFNTYEVVRGMLSVVQQDGSFEKGWNDPNRNDVMQARQAVAVQVAELAAIQQAPSETARCQEIGQFEPLLASTFTLLFLPSQNGLVRDFTTLTHAWNTAQRTPVPQIAGLSLSWLVTAQTYQHQSQGASRLVARITTAYTQDEQAMQHLAQQERTITQQVAQLGKACPPTPA